MTIRTDRDFARALDDADPLRAFRDAFALPHNANDEPLVYLCGNSLGLMPHAAREAVGQELDDWGRWGVDGHLRAAHPWYSYHEQFKESGAKLVGARPGEVVMMNTLSVNLHLLMASFYRPSGDRTRILIENQAFSSDRYVVQTHAAWHGLTARDTIVEVGPAGDGPALETGDVLAQLEEHGTEVALVLLSGVNYYTGQWFDIPTITHAARARGCVVGWDLAHAAGNVPLALHDWEVDFAAWCSYKYINAGPGAVAGAFIHERHGKDPTVPRLGGWWGNDPETRFQMHKNRRFVPRDGADGWQLSNPPILSLAPVRTSLDLFEQADLRSLRAKSVQLTGYLEGLIDGLETDQVSIITPRDPDRRGCQLSIRVGGTDPRRLFSALTQAGVVGDFREPDVIRLAPVPLYNTFTDVWTAVDAMGRGLGGPGFPPATS